MKISGRTAVCIFAVIFLLGITILAGVSYLALKYTDQYPDDEKAFLWYNVRMELDGSDHTRSRIVSYAYIEADCTIREYAYSDKINYEYNYSQCLDRPPMLSIDPERFIGLARERMRTIDPSAEFRKFEYMLPDIARTYFGVEKPYIEVRFTGKDREYVVIYDAGTGSEEKFLEEPLIEYPICMTTAERNDGRCTYMRFQLGDIVYNQAFRYTWQPALEWIKEETLSTAGVQTWWDYYILCSVKSGHKCFPDSRNIEQIDDAAAFYMSDQNEDEALELLHKNGVKYIIVDWDLMGKSGALRYIASSNAGNGNYNAYASCYFSPDQSSLKPAPRIGANNTESDMVSMLAYSCNNGMYLIFEIVNGQYSSDNVFLAWASNPSNRIPWKKWQKEKGTSILGPQPLKDILDNCLNYPKKYVNLPTFNSFVYLPGRNETIDGKNTAEFMLSRLYFGEHIQEYKQAGLANSDIEPLHKIRLVPGFESSKQNNSYWGYVKVFEVTG
jgi:hypothetical protein